MRNQPRYEIMYSSRTFCLSWPAQRRLPKYEYDLYWQFNIKCAWLYAFRPSHVLSPELRIRART